MEVVVVFGPGAGTEFVKDIDGWHINEDLLTLYRWVDEMQHDVASFNGWHMIKVTKE